MTETAERSTAGNGDSSAADDDTGTSALPSDKLKQAAEALLKALSDRAVGAAVDQVEGLAGRLTGVAESGGAGLSSVFGGGGGDDGEEAAVVVA